MVDAGRSPFKTEAKVPQGSPAALITTPHHAAVSAGHRPDRDHIGAISAADRLLLGPSPAHDTCFYRAPDRCRGRQDIPVSRHPRVKTSPGQDPQ
jgi:hypothetical protein